MEIIPIDTAEDQNKVVIYGDRSIEFRIRWNEKSLLWTLSLYENEVPLLCGISMALNSNLLYDRLKLGKLYLIDTLYQKTTKPVSKSDLGNRLILGRIF